MNAHSMIEPTAHTSDTDDFTAGFIAAFEERERLDDVPDGEVSKQQLLLADFMLAGARATAADKVQETAAQATISAIIAYDEIQEIYMSHESGFRKDPLCADEREALRLAVKALGHACVFLYKNGGGAARPIAAWHGLLGEEA